VTPAAGGRINSISKVLNPRHAFADLSACLQARRAGGGARQRRLLTLALSPSLNIKNCEWTILRTTEYTFKCDWTPNQLTGGRGQSAVLTVVNPQGCGGRGCIAISFCLPTPPPPPRTLRVRVPWEFLLHLTFFQRILDNLGTSASLTSIPRASPPPLRPLFAPSPSPYIFTPLNDS